MSRRTSLRFAVDGGVIIFGVDEREDGTFEMAPHDMDGWREWIDQIALHSVEPSVRVTTSALRQDGGDGCLVVVVPPSTRAPHMVDGRYWRRSDNTNVALRDSEARELWQRNLQRRIDAEALISAEIERRSCK